MFPVNGEHSTLDTCVAPGFTFYVLGDYVLSKFDNREVGWRGFTSAH